jgi:hypothetical protein
VLSTMAAPRRRRWSHTHPSMTPRQPASRIGWVKSYLVSAIGLPVKVKRVIIIAAVFLVALATQRAPAENIPLQPSQGVYMLPVRINDTITIPFVLDSGASDVVVPADIFSTLRRSGTVSQADFRGTANATLANGSTVSSDRYVLHKMVVGNVVINDALTSISPAEGEPLLGQSFLSKLPSWSIDNAHHVLVFNGGEAGRNGEKQQTGPVTPQTPVPSPLAPRQPGMSATRDEYFAHLVTLTRQHTNLLPMSVVGERRGETVISVVVYDNGGIGPLGILRGSGYPDIDQRIEAMVTAVGKFPPLPQWYQHKAQSQFVLTLKFPERSTAPMLQ